MYLDDSNDYLPVVEPLPSLPLDDNHPRPAIATVLSPYLQKAADAAEREADNVLELEGNEIFRCPADTPGYDNREGENNGKSYFDTENSSYTFNTHLHFLRDSGSLNGGLFEKPVKLSEIVRTERAKRMFGGTAAEEEIWLMRDYVGFHGKPGTPHASNYLYVDGRVSDLER